MNPSSRKRLKDKVAIVTGAGRSIGRAEALLLAAQGAKVVVNDLGGGPTGGGADASIAETVVEQIKKNGGEAVANTASVASMEGAQALIETALKAFGRIDILINNAGIIRPGRVDQLTEADWDLVHNVSLKGYFATIRQAAPHMISQGEGGAILNTSSSSGFGHYAMANYSAAKEGIIGLTRTVARDLGQFGIRCNAIRPQSNESNLAIDSLFEYIKIGEKLGQTMLWNKPVNYNPPVPALADPVAALAVWLCTDACAHVSGREFHVQGGEVALFPEPEFSRISFNPKGWDIDSLDDPGVREYLVGDIPNRFVRKAGSNP